MASTTDSIETGVYLYLYGITLARDPAQIDTRGVGEGEVEGIVVGSLAAIATRTRDRKFRPTRSNLAAHNQLLKDLAERQAVLPAVFGTVVRSERQLRDVLRQHHPVLLNRLAELHRKVEMSLKVYWETTNIFEFFVTTQQELRRMRDRLFRGGRKPSMKESIELGELFAGVLQQARDRHTERITRALAPCCAETRQVDPGNEKMIVKLACLVKKDRQQQWEDEVVAMAERFNEHYRFEYSGPSIPYDFAGVELDLELA